MLLVVLGCLVIPALASAHAALIRSAPASDQIVKTSPTGWRSTGRTVPLTPPVQIGGQTIAIRIATVTWTGGRIRPGRSAQFRVRVRVREGSKVRGLAFPAV